MFLSTGSESESNNIAAAAAKLAQALQELLRVE